MILLAILLFLVPFHPFFSTYFLSLLPEQYHQAGFFISAWKELLLVVVCGLVPWVVLKTRTTFRFGSIDLAIILFTGISLLIGILYTGEGQPQRIQQLIWGVKYGLFFLIAFLFICHIPFTKRERSIMRAAVLVSAATVILFGIAQATVLPENFLVRFGYNPEYGITEPGHGLSYCHKIENSITHQEFCRIQSTLSGPNQLGAYLLIVLPIFFYLLLQVQNIWARISLSSIIIAGVILLILTWSRSAWIGAIAEATAFFILRSRKPGITLLYLGIFALGIISLFIPALYIEQWDTLKPFALGAGMLFLFLLSALSFINLKQRFFPVAVGMIFPVLFCGLLLARARFDTFFWNIILRPSSSQGHWERWTDGVQYIIRYPQGLGLGDAGPASARFALPGQTGFVPESWYLQVGLESGVIGLILFVTILILVGYALVNRSSLEAKGLLLALIGVSVACLFLHSWEASEVALTFWVFTGVALAPEPIVPFITRIRRFITGFFRT